MPFLAFCLFYLASCATKKYDDDLPSASIVICFHNEATSALLRTAKTALERGGGKHIVEILLIDDASTFGKCCVKTPLASGQCTM